MRSQHRVALTTLIDTSRAAEIAPRDLSTDLIQAWLAAAHTAQRKKLRSGLKALDALRSIDRLRPLLPLSPVTPAAKPAGRFAALPEPLQRAINGWVDVAAQEQVDDPRYAHLAEPLSASARATYRAATSLYVQTLLELYPGLSGETDLTLARHLSAFDALHDIPAVAGSGLLPARIGPIR